MAQQLHKHGMLGGKAGISLVANMTSKARILYWGSGLLLSYPPVLRCAWLRANISGFIGVRRAGVPP